MGSVTVDKQVFQTVVEGVEQAKNKINTLAKTYLSAMSGIEKSGVRGTAGIVSANKKLTTQLENTVKHTENLSKSMKGLGTQTAKTESMLGFLRGGLKNMIVTGMFMSIGWQAINTVLTTVTSSISRLAEVGITLEKQQISLAGVARSTGRSFSEVTQVIEKHIDSLADRATLTSMVTKLLSTGLSTEQIDKYIQAVKDGSAVFSSFRIEAEKQALALKRLEPRVTDNIGVEFKLNQVYAQTAKQLGKTMQSLTVAEREQAYYKAVIEGTIPYQDAHNRLLLTTEGAIQRVAVEWDKLGEALSNTGPLKEVASAIGDVIEGWKIMANEMGKYKFQYTTMLGLMEEEEAAKARRSEAGKNMLAAIDEENKEMDIQNSKLVAVKEGIEDLQRSIENKSILLNKYNLDLREVNNELQKWTDIQKDAEKAVNKLESALEKKRKALYPEEYKETEDKYKDIQKELDRLMSKYADLHETLRSTTSYREYIKTVGEAEAVEAEISKLRGEETTVTKKLKGEISDIEKKLAAENKRKAEAITHVQTWTEKQNNLNKKILETRDSITYMNDTIILARRYIKDEIEPALDDLESNISDINTELDSFITNWIKAKDLPNLVKKIQVDYEGRITEQAISQRLQSGNPLLIAEGLAAGVVKGLGFQTGTPFVPKTGMYQLHQGEQVIPKSQTYNQQSYSIRVGQLNTGGKEESQFFNKLYNTIGMKVSQ